MYKRILLAYDGSEAGQKALLDTREIAQLTHGEVYLLAVMPPAAAFMGGEGYVMTFVGCVLVFVGVACVRYWKHRQLVRETEDSIEGEPLAEH